jgi:hypothetical protein
VPNLKKKVTTRDVSMRYGDDPELRERMKSRVRMLESWGDGDQATVDTLEAAEGSYKKNNGYKPRKQGLRR